MTPRFPSKGSSNRRRMVRVRVPPIITILTRFDSVNTFGVKVILESDTTRFPDFDNEVMIGDKRYVQPLKVYLSD